MMEVGIAYLIGFFGFTIWTWVAIRVKDSYMTNWEAGSLALFTGLIWPVLLLMAIFYYIQIWMGLQFLDRFFNRKK